MLWKNVKMITLSYYHEKRNETLFILNHSQLGIKKNVKLINDFERWFWWKQLTKRSMNILVDCNNIRVWAIVYSAQYITFRCIIGLLTSFAIVELIYYSILSQMTLFGCWNWVSVL